MMGVLHGNSTNAWPRMRPPFIIFTLILPSLPRKRPNMAMRSSSIVSRWMFFTYSSCQW